MGTREFGTSRGSSFVFLMELQFLGSQQGQAAQEAAGHFEK